MKWGQPEYKPDRVNHGASKAIYVEVDKKLYDAITAIAKRQNKNRAALLRPFLEEFVQQHREL